MDTIRDMGLRAGDGRWKLSFPRLPTDEDRASAAGRVDDANMAVCACGDEASAAHYAWVRNRGPTKTTPIMIEMEVNASTIAIDGRDFLYTVFAGGDPPRALPALSTAFGDAVLPHVNAAWSASDGSQRLAHAYRAVLAPDVVAAHHANRAVIAGRFDTVFASAFLVRLPVPPSAILRVWTPTDEPKPTAPSIHIDDLLLPR